LAGQGWPAFRQKEIQYWSGLRSYVGHRCIALFYFYSFGDLLLMRRKIEVDFVLINVMILVGLTQ
jgi:hypothetical protein